MKKFVRLLSLLLVLLIVNVLRRELLPVTLHVVADVAKKRINL